jgi:hypothetical protein
MSTRQSVWVGENDGKTVHIYFELAERMLVDGRMSSPIYIAAEGTDANKEPIEVAMRLPKKIGKALLAVLSKPSRRGPLTQTEPKLT